MLLMVVCISDASVIRSAGLGCACGCARLVISFRSCSRAPYALRVGCMRSVFLISVPLLLVVAVAADGCAVVGRA